MHLTDDQVRAAIAQTASPLSLRRIAETCRQLYGSPGGKQRLYRVWQMVEREAEEFRMRNSAPTCHHCGGLGVLSAPKAIPIEPAARTDAPADNERVRIAEARAERAEEHERLFAEKWMPVVHQLREENARLKRQAGAGGGSVSADEYLRVHRLLEHNRRRIELLESKLADLGVEYEALGAEG